MPRIFSVLSGKGGVGKSTFAASAAVYTARRGMKALLIDGDIGLRCIDLILNVQDKVVFDFGDLLDENCDAGQALMRIEAIPGLYLLSAPQHVTADEVDTARLTGIIRTIAEQMDLVLFDAPAGINEAVRPIAGLESIPLIVVTPDDISVRDGERMAQILDSRGEERPHLIVNRVNRKMVRRGEMQSPESIARNLDLRLDGILPDSRRVYPAQLRRVLPLDAGDEEFNEGIEIAVSRMLGAETPLPEYKKSAVLSYFSQGGRT